MILLIISSTLFFAPRYYEPAGIWLPFGDYEMNTCHGISIDITMRRIPDASNHYLCIGFVERVYIPPQNFEVPLL